MLSKIGPCHLRQAHFLHTQTGHLGMCLIRIQLILLSNVNRWAHSAIRAGIFQPHTQCVSSNAKLHSYDGDTIQAAYTHIMRTTLFGDKAECETIRPVIDLECGVVLKNPHLRGSRLSFLFHIE